MRSSDLCHTRWKNGSLSSALEVAARNAMRDSAITYSHSDTTQMHAQMMKTKSKSPLASSISDGSSISNSKESWPGFVIITKCITRHTNHKPRAAVGDMKLQRLASSVEAVQDPRVSSTLETFIAISASRGSANVLRATQFLRRAVPDVFVPETVVRNALAALRRQEDDATVAQDLLGDMHRAGDVTHISVGRSDEGILNYIFFAPRGARELVTRCGDVVTIDSTHHMTRYDYKTTCVIAIDSLGKSRCTSVCLAMRKDARTMSRMLADWAMAMRPVNSPDPVPLPRVVFTDDDCGLSGALSMAPDADARMYFLCIWHLIDNNVYSHVANCLEGGPSNWILFRSQMDEVRESPTEGAFDRLWNEMISRWLPMNPENFRQQQRARRYLQHHVYSKRTRWALCFSQLLQLWECKALSALKGFTRC